MRDGGSWYQPLARDLSPGLACGARCRQAIPALPGRTGPAAAGTARIPPTAPLAPTPFFSGYRLAAAMGIAAAPEQQAMLTIARHLLWRLRRGRQWAQALETYQELPERLRGYRIPAEGGPPRRVEPTVSRRPVRALQPRDAVPVLPDFDRRALPLVGPGPSRFTDRRRPAAVTVDEELCLAPAPGHDLDDIPGATGGPLQVPLAELAKTARWMDDTEERQGLKPGSWSQRLQDMQLDTVSARRPLLPALLDPDAQPTASPRRHGGIRQKHADDTDRRVGSRQGPADHPGRRGRRRTTHPLSSVPRPWPARSAVSAPPPADSTPGACAAASPPAGKAPCSPTTTPASTTSAPRA